MLLAARFPVMRCCPARNVLTPLLSLSSRRLSSLPPPPAPSPPASPSVVEELLSTRAASSTSSIPLGPGETLVYESGMRAWLGVSLQLLMTSTLSAWIGALSFAPADVGALAAVGSPMHSALLMAAGFLGLTTVGYVRRTVRYAVLDRDGSALRMTSFAASWGAAAPVEVPCRALSLHDPGPAADARSLYVALSGLVLTLDKPVALMPWVGGRGTGLVMGARGLTATLPDPARAPALDSRGEVPVARLYDLSPVERDAMRRYALLAHCLSGKPVSAHAVRTGSWELQDMIAQLDASGGTGERARLAELRYWRRALDKASGQEYWWHIVTSAVQWSPPEVDGKTPADVALLDSALEREAAVAAG